MDSSYSKGRGDEFLSHRLLLIALSFLTISSEKNETRTLCLLKHEVAVELAGSKRLSLRTGRMAVVMGAAGGPRVKPLFLPLLYFLTKRGNRLFPLTVDYIANDPDAGGRIPGGFNGAKRRPSEKRSSCLPPDRSSHPSALSFSFCNEIPVIALVFSADKENDNPDASR